MFARNRRRLASFMALALWFTALAPLCPTATTFAQDSKKDDKKKDDKNKDTDKNKMTKEEKEYQKIKKFGVELYNKEADFREDVETSFLQKQREHMFYAFNVNMRDSNDDLVSHSGDKVKIEDSLYDNPLAQDYVNRVGQSIVPADSKSLYAFRITLNPVPESRALSTGTVYISTGMLSSIDNEAQLAYILGHEIAHVERQHWKEDVLVAAAVEPYNKKQERKRALFGAMIGVAAGAIAGGAGASAGTSFNVGYLAFSGSSTLLKLFVRDAPSSWDRQQEDEADQASLTYMLGRNYDVREVPKFYANMKRTSVSDPRMQQGFIADKERVAEREEAVKNFIGTSAPSMQKALFVGSSNLADLRPGKTLAPERNSAAREAAINRTVSGALAAEVQTKLENGELLGSTAEFESIMAALKRDNGVLAFYFDMFQVSRDNLEESLMIRNNDPYTYFYYGKVLKQTGRTAADRAKSLNMLARAIQLDTRRILPEAHLYTALTKIQNKEQVPAREIIDGLKEYVTLYQRRNGGALPPHMDAIYDYLQDVGESNWRALPVVATKDYEPITNSPGPVSIPTASAPAPVQPQASPTPRKRP